MSKPKIVVVVPSIRPESMEKFREAWRPLFEKHEVTLITVWDGESPRIEEFNRVDEIEHSFAAFQREPYKSNRDLFCRFTDACRNIGFVLAAQLQPDYVLTLDDDCYPLSYELDEKHNVISNLEDPIQAHIDALNRKCSITWMNTAHDTDLYLRGVPYSVRDEAPMMLSHGVWVGTPDFDGETQLRLEACPVCKGEKVIEHNGKLFDCDGCKSTGKFNHVPYALPYYVGPIPRGVLFPICGMNVMVRKEALPYLYFAPMGPDSGVKCERCDGDGKAHGSDRPFESSGPGTYPGPCPVCKGSKSPLHRFSDIWMGITLKREFDLLGWAVYTGASTILHTRASDARKNFEQEKLGRAWNEWMTNRAYAVEEKDQPEFARFTQYLAAYHEKRRRYGELINSILKGDKSV